MKPEFRLAPNMFLLRGIHTHSFLLYVLWIRVCTDSEIINKGFLDSDQSILLLLQVFPELTGKTSLDFRGCHWDVHCIKYCQLGHLCLYKTIQNALKKVKEKSLLSANCNEASLAAEGSRGQQKTLEVDFAAGHILSVHPTQSSHTPHLFAKALPFLREQ